MSKIVADITFLQSIVFDFGQDKCKMYTKFFDQTVYIYFYGFSDKATHLCIKNLFSGAIEMDQVFGSSPMACVKPSTVGNGSNSSNELVLISCLYKTCVQSWQLAYLQG